MKLAVRREGRGPPLVCHPGGPGFSALYLGDLAGLGERLELILFDPRGTGQTPRPGDVRGYAIADYVDDLEELRRELGLETMSLFGHSHGGMVAIAYAAAHPGRLDRLVLASTLARFAAEQEAAMEAGIRRHEGEPWYEDARAALQAEQSGDFSSDEELGELALREFRFYFARYGGAEGAYLERLRAETPNADALRLFNNESFTSFDLRPQLERIDVPTLVITGEHDFITGPLCADEIVQRLPRGELVILEDAGHFIFVEAPERFRDEVWRFMGVA